MLPLGISLDLRQESFPCQASMQQEPWEGDQIFCCAVWFASKLELYFHRFLESDAQQQHLGIDGIPTLQANSSHDQD